MFSRRFKRRILLGCLVRPLQERVMIYNEQPDITIDHLTGESSESQANLYLEAI